MDAILKSRIKKGVGITLLVVIAIVIYNKVKKDTNSSVVVNTNSNNNSNNSGGNNTNNQTSLNTPKEKTKDELVKDAIAKMVKYFPPEFDTNTGVKKKILFQHQYLNKAKMQTELNNLSVNKLKNVNEFYSLLISGKGAMDDDVVALTNTLSDYFLDKGIPFFYI